ncbi:ImmA/IrrE family metallo-endopeptidase [Magnetospirillum molischianum]|uniref:Putative transcriptional regulator n=1 Tax=Magnetospirillum molischianum DSM 120 TaxID=1150626 RepID=H8FWP7_MAGML|nr:ImmA/IrrE family metallo-endopeptidase [Magnetospirillum molischianum]CCG42785.1 Putative transcriptional regulator [Magnetospirillum molischianum DSM 120]
MTVDELKAVFGADSNGETAEERASTSQTQFVRSQHQLSFYKENATGRKINAKEALRLFGWNTLKHLADKLSTPILENKDEPYRSIQNQLNSLGLELDFVAKKIHWTDESINRFKERRQVSFRDLEKISRTLGLNEDYLGKNINSSEANTLGIRLRKLRSSDSVKFTENTALRLAEAAWTIQKQNEISALYERNRNDPRGDFSPEPDYGDKWHPDYKVGYELAQKARKILGIKEGDPVLSIKEVIEDWLRIPVIQLELHSSFAGATVAAGDHRGIVINVTGENKNPLIRRMTMAHELGHLLWDPDEKLQKITIDGYNLINKDVGETSLDHVERRANAFAIEFLAPGAAIINEFRTAGEGSTGLESIIAKYGIGRMAAGYHLANSSNHQIDADHIKIRNPDFSEWEGRESLAVPLFQPESVPISRRGRFAYCIVCALDNGLISRDTAASLFGCSERELHLAIKTTRDYISPA